MRLLGFRVERIVELTAATATADVGTVVATYNTVNTNFRLGISIDYKMCRRAWLTASSHNTGYRGLLEFGIDTY